MPSTLDALTDRLDETTVRILGDPITVTRDGGSPISIMAFVDHGERVRDYGFTTVVEGDRAVAIRKADLAEIDRFAIVHLAQIGLDCVPREIRDDESGRWHLVALKRKPG